MQWRLSPAPLHDPGEMGEEGCPVGVLVEVGRLVEAGVLVWLLEGRDAVWPRESSAPCGELRPWSWTVCWMWL